MQQNRIFLVGFMASGKSCIGKLLANKLQYKYVDADDYIEAKAQQTVPQIFEERGEVYFRKLEQTCLHELIQEEQILISTGGGMACYFDNMAQMNSSGLTIFLEVSPPIIVNRLLEAKNTRPLVKEFENDRGALLNFIEGKLTERLPFYREAHITVDCKTQSANKIAGLLYEGIVQVDR